MIRADLLRWRKAQPTPRAAWLLLVTPIFAALATTIGLEAPIPWGLGLLALAAASALALLVWHRPVLAASFIPLLLPPPEFLKTFVYELAALAAFVIVAAAGWAARRQWLWKLDRIEVAVIGFVLWGGVSCLWSSSTWWWAFAMRKYGMGALALWTVWRLARDRRSTIWLMQGIAAGAAVLSIATLYKALSSGVMTSGMSFNRREGTDMGWGTANYIAAILVLMLPTSLHLAMHGADRRSRWLGWFSLPLSALVMAVTASRGGALLMVGFALFYIFNQRISRRTLLLVAAFAVAIGLLAVGPGSQLFLSRFSSPRELGSLVVRLALLREGWRRIVTYFPFGMGFGQGWVEPDHMGPGIPHNFFVLVTYEVGLPGLVLWVTVLWLIARRGLEELRRPGRRLTAQTLLFTLGVAVLNSCFEGTFEGLHFQFMFFWIVGILLGTLAQPVAIDDPGAPNVNLPGRPPRAAPAM